MTIQSTLTTMEIYIQYIQLREAGTPLENTIWQLEPQVVSLDDASLTELNQMIVDWEQDHGDATNQPPPPDHPIRKDPALPREIQPIHMA